MEKIFEGKESMFSDPFAICCSDKGEYWLYKQMDDSDPISIPLSKETALAMAQAIIKEQGYVSMPKEAYELLTRKDRERSDNEHS